MKPTPLYLKFPDEAAAKAALFIQVPISYDESGEPVEFEAVPSFQNLYIPPEGKFFREIETGDPENPVEPVLLEGYHANLLLLDGEDAAGLEPYMIEPETPVCVWSVAP